MLTPQLAAAARTVVHIADHFESLKQAAAALDEVFAASRRGYFTPQEDEETRHLLVSYWQARCALYDLINDLREEFEPRREIYPQAFMIGFGAALVLVDGARFLRDAFDGRPVVRAKLNEPDPHFRIPPGVYDTVQRSLLSGRHAWQLFHATEYFDEHHRRLQDEAARERALVPVLALVERLVERVRISPSRFARAAVRVRSGRAARKVTQQFGRVLYRLQQMVSSMVSEVYTRPGHHPCLPAAVQQQLSEIVQPGDVLMTRKEFALTNYFLPGYWPHAALYLGAAEELRALGVHQHEHFASRWERLLHVDPLQPRRVLEAMKDGVWIRSLASPLSSDAVGVLRPKLSREQIAIGLTRGMFHEGKAYDFDFDFTRSDRLVCTEVVYRSYDGLGGLRFPLTRRAGRLTLAAEDIIRLALDGQGLEPVAAYAPAFAPCVVVGDQAADALRATSQGG